MHSIALFGRLGEIAAEYLARAPRFIEGKLRTANGRTSKEMTVHHRNHRDNMQCSR